MSNRQNGTPTGKPYGVFRAVKDAVTTRQAAECYGITVSRNGMALCPFHEDHTPSMKLDRRFHCFGCQADGDVIDFTALLFGINALEATRKLEADFGIDTPKYGQSYPLKSRVFPDDADRAVGVFTRYLQFLNRCRIEYAPRSESVPWHPLFEESMRRRDHIAYLLEEFQFGNKETRAALARAYREEVENLERRLSEFDSISQKAG